MLRECARLLQPPHGLLASVSFASPARLKLLHAGCPPLGLQWRVHVLGDGDPARGHEVGDGVSGWVGPAGQAGLLTAQSCL